MSADAERPKRNLSQATRLAARADRQRIVSEPGICGGDARINGSRIEVWLLESFRRRGVSDAQLLEIYPMLEAADLASAWEYVARHGDEIESLILANN